MSTDTTAAPARKLRVYMAGPLFTLAERAWNRRLAAHLRGDGFDVFVPQEGEPLGEGPEAVFKHDLGGLRWADAVLVNLDGCMVDDGTSWEVGWAFARRYPIVGYRTDIRNQPARSGVNLMISCSCSTIVETRPGPEADPGAVFEAVTKALDKWSLNRQG